MEKTNMQIDQIAPCGMNCMTCMAFLRKKRSCPGCRKESNYKAKGPMSCLIKNCDELTGNALSYCYGCRRFPCARMKKLDERYRKNYGFGMIENLLNIKKDGMKRFIRNEKKRWICSECGGVISVHRGYCTDCRKVYYYHSGTDRAPFK
jgi:hypothetical protein